MKTTTIKILAASAAVILTSCAAPVDPNYTITRDVSVLTSEDWGWRVYNYEDIQLDEHGNLASVRCKIVPVTMTFEYNDNGQITKCVGDHGMYGIETITFSYNADGTHSKTHFETVKDGSVKESYDHVFTYDSNGRLTTWKHRDTTYNYSYDDSGKIVKESSTDGIKEFQYGDNGFAVTQIDDSYHSNYEYDARGNFLKIKTIYSDGDVITTNYKYEVVGSIEESPETNPNLIPRTEWTYIDSEKTIPSPESCIKNIRSVGDGIYVLPSTLGSYHFGMGTFEWFEPSLVESKRAFTAIDQYLNILTDVCELEVTGSNWSCVVKKEDKTIASIHIAVDPSVGYYMVVTQ